LSLWPIEWLWQGRCNAKFIFTMGNLRIDFASIPRDDSGVKVDAAKKTKSEAELLDQATGQLLKAVKQKMLKKQGRLDYSKLRKDGYSERFLARLEEA